MSAGYLIDPRRSLRKEVRRIASAELNRAAAALEAGAAGSVTAARACFRARKAIKRVRALYRLVRSADPDGFGAENAPLSAIATALASLRDQAAMAQAAQRLAAGFASGTAERGLLDRLAAHILAEARDTSPELSSAVLLAGQAQACRAAAAAARRLQVPKETGRAIGVIAHGLKRTCRDAQHRLDVALGSGETEDWHAFRSRIKAHRLHVRLLQAAWPAGMAARARDAGLLTDMLGEDHDLANLQDYAESRPGAVQWPDEITLLCAMVRTRQQELREQAEAAAMTLLAGGARQTAQRIATLWKAAIRDAR